ncbi:MAG: transcriptional repressor [Gammaproteobacteria bacterium]|nr:transcriptional repressor [Gammaproteobacteria bacterium]
MSILEVRERVIGQLLEHDVRPTAQRVEIALQVLTRPCHFSAEQLLASLRQAGSGISKATVYNTLNLFSERGLIREIAVDPHHHVYNAATGELLDIDPAELHLSKLPPLPRATEAESVEVLIRLRAKPAG